MYCLQSKNSNFVFTIIRTADNQVQSYLKTMSYLCNLNNQTLIIYMSLGCLSKELEKLLNAENFQNRIELKRFQKWSAKVTQKNQPQLLLKKSSANIIKKKMTDNCYSKIDPQTLLKKWPATATQKMIEKRYTKNDPQTLLKKKIHKRYSESDSPTPLKYDHKHYSKMTHKRYSTLNYEHGRFLSDEQEPQKWSKTFSPSWLFFDWKIASTSYKKLMTPLWNMNYLPSSLI